MIQAFKAMEAAGSQVNPAVLSGVINHSSRLGSGEPGIDVKQLPIAPN